MIIAVRLTPSRTNSDIEFDYMSRKELEKSRTDSEEPGREEKSQEERRRCGVWGMEFELRARDARSEPIGDEYIRSILLAIHLYEAPWHV